MFNEKEYMEKYYQRNKKKLNRQKELWRENNPEKRKEQGRKNFQNNKIIILKRNKQWREDNPKYMKKYIKQYQIEHRKELNEYARQWKKNKYKINIKYNLNVKISRVINESLKGNKNGWHWEDLVGYKLIDLIKRLQKTIPKGYSWRDFLEGKLHIDHIIPISVFNFNKSEHIDFKRCWSLENLQLLPAKENIIKKNKLTKPFQPALAI